MAKNRITELKSQESAQRRQELLFNQQNEQQEVENAHLVEYQEFNKNWDDLMQKQAEESELMMRALEEKHIKELEENRSRLEQGLPPQPKDSAELLNMRKIQQQLAKQKE